MRAERILNIRGIRGTIKAFSIITIMKVINHHIGTMKISQGIIGRKLTTGINIGPDKKDEMIVINRKTNTWRIIAETQIIE